jgi:DNA-binding NarL/FixJ family response regulator
LLAQGMGHLLRLSINMQQPFDLADKSIIIAGHEDFKKALISYFLEHQGGALCSVVDHLDDAGEMSETNDGHDLVLWDINQVDDIDLFSSLESYKNRSDIPLALYDVDPERRLESKALLNGVQGFFYTVDPLELLLKGLVHLCKGEVWIPRKIMERCLFDIKKAGIGGKTRSKSGLTKREMEVLELIHHGYSNSDIADQLCVSVHTVKAHTYKAFKKIGVSNRVQASRWVAENLLNNTAR